MTTRGETILGEQIFDCCLPAIEWLRMSARKNLVPLLRAGQGTDKACTETKSGADIFCQLFLIRSGSYEKGLIMIFKRTKQKVKILFYNGSKKNMKHEQFSVTCVSVSESVWLRKPEHGLTLYKRELNFQLKVWKFIIIIIEKLSNKDKAGFVQVGYLGGVWWGNQ